MRWLLSSLLLALLLTGSCAANSPAPQRSVSVAQRSAPAAKPPVPAALPDYGGRESPSVLTGVGADAPNPIVQAGRSVLALVVVLGGVVGVITLLKRSGYTGSSPIGLCFLSGLRSVAFQSSRNGEHRNDTVDSKEETGNDTPLMLTQSQALPGGGSVHLLTVNGTTRILVGATAQSVSLIAEWEWEETETEASSKIVPNPVSNRSFSQHLARAGAAPAFQNKLSDLLADTRVQTIENKHA